MLTIPADYTAECSDEHPLDQATATDNCGMVTIEEVADTTYSCPNSYVVTTYVHCDGRVFSPQRLNGYSDHHDSGHHGASVD